MKIGIDIDGTISTAYYWLDFFNAHLNTSLRPEDIKHYDHYLDFGITREDFAQFRRRHLEDIHRLADPRRGAEAHVNRLYFEDNDTYIITAREKELIPLTQGWLEKYAMVYTKLYHLGSTAKSNLAVQLKLDVFLEDRYETALDMVGKGIPTILFNTNYNQMGDHPMIYRVDTWQEAYQVIESLKVKKSRIGEKHDQTAQKNMAF